MDRVINWQGLDFLSAESDLNPLIASYIGAPYMIRGTDPAEYARAAREYFGQAPTAMVAGPTAAATSALTAPVEGAAVGVWDKIKTGAAGAILGILIVTLGVAYILWGRD